MDETEKAPWGKYALIAVPAIVIAGTAIGILTGSGQDNRWYMSLVKPPLTPPGWVFPLVWTVLYAMMGSALAMVLAAPENPRRRMALILFAIQLALNFAWSPIFFAAHDISLAKYVIFVMTVVAAGAAGQFLRISRLAGFLMTPYLAWLVFASVLNSMIDTLNPGAGTSLFG